MDRRSCQSNGIEDGLEPVKKINYKAAMKEEQDLSMRKYMGYPFEKQLQPVAPRPLPQCEIEGTSFYIDIRHHELREVGRESNRLSLGATREEYGFHSFLYDTRIKSFYLGDTNPLIPVPEHVRMVMVPPLKKLDPVGLALRQGLPADYHGEGNGKIRLMSLAVEARKRVIKKRGRRIG